MIAFRRLIPQSSVDDADNAGVCEIADQSPDALLELDNHFGNANIHQSILSNGTLILDNRIGDRERKPENDDILVKLLLNEREVTLPVKTDCAPFYHWKDVRAYWQKVVDSISLPDVEVTQED